MKSIIFLSLNILTIFLFTQIEVLACGCAARSKDITKAVTKDFNRAAIVFSGRVIAKEFVPTNKHNSSTAKIGGSETLIIRFAVDNWWKGNSKGEITLDTSNIRFPGLGIGQGAGCEYSFEAGEKYLVYATNTKGKLIAYECSGTTPIERAEKDIKELQRLKTVKRKSLTR